jgi:hypothetical protein
VALIACRHLDASAPPPPPPPPPPSPSPPPSRACAAIAPTCDPAISDRAALAVVGAHCRPCHDAGGVARHPLLDADTLRAAPVAELVGACQMPPDGAPALDDDERRILITWAACAR